VTPFHYQIFNQISNYSNEPSPSISLAGRSQCQETGRDQAHAQMGLEFLSNTAETGWIQGVDLYRALNQSVAAPSPGEL